MAWFLKPGHRQPLDWPTWPRSDWTDRRRSAHRLVRALSRQGLHRIFVLAQIGRQRDSLSVVVGRLLIFHLIPGSVAFTAMDCGTAFNAASLPGCRIRNCWRSTRLPGGFGMCPGCLDLRKPAGDGLVQLHDVAEPHSDGPRGVAAVVAAALCSLCRNGLLRSELEHHLLLGATDWADSLLLCLLPSSCSALAPRLVFSTRRTASI